VTRPQPEWPAWILLGIFATVIATNAFDYSVLVPQPQLRYEMHRAIVDGSAPSPQRFRILVPRLLDPIIRAWPAADPEQAFRRVYFVFHGVALTALLAGVYAYCRLWFSRDRALIGALIIGSTLHLVLRMGEYWDFSPIPDRTWYAPWSLLEPAFVAAAVLLLSKRLVGPLAILTVVAAVNSEASILLPLLALVVPDDVRPLSTSLRARDGAMLLALWVVATAILRIGVGDSAWPTVTITENLAHLPSSAINLGLFLGPAGLLAFIGFRHAPAAAQRALLAAIPLAIGVALFGYWWDVRLLTPLYPLAAPLILSAMFEPLRDR
jgi:hypothetical protein